MLQCFRRLILKERTLKNTVWELERIDHIEEGTDLERHASAPGSEGARKMPVGCPAQASKEAAGDRCVCG